MEITVSHEQGRVDVTVLAVKGDITVQSYEQLQERFEQEQKLGTKYVLLDLKEVPYISSSGLRAIHHIFNLLEGDSEPMRKEMSAGKFKSTHLKLLSPSKDVLNVLKITGYDYFLEIFDNREKAIASF